MTVVGITPYSYTFIWMTFNFIIFNCWQNVRSMQRNMNMTLSSVGMTPSQADAAALQQLQLGTMFPFDPLGVVGQMQVQSQQQVYYQLKQKYDANNLK